MANRRSRDTSIVERLLAARQAGAKLRGGDPSQPGSNDFAEQPASAMSSAQRSDLVTELLKLRQQQPSSQQPLAAPLHPHVTAPEVDSDIAYSPGPPKSTITRSPGELVSPASSPGSSNRQQPSASTHAMPSPHRRSHDLPAPQGHNPVVKDSIPHQQASGTSYSRTPQPPAQPSPHRSDVRQGTRTLLASVAGALDSSVFAAGGFSVDSLHANGVPPPQPSASPRRPHQPTPCGPKPGGNHLGPDSLMIQESSCMVLRGECSEQPLYSSLATTGACLARPQHAWPAPDTTRGALPLRFSGAGAPTAADVADNNAGTCFAPSREASDPAERGHVGVAADAAGGAGRNVSFGHESVTTAGTQSIFFAEDLLREQRGGGGGGGAGGGGSDSDDSGDGRAHGGQSPAQFVHRGGGHPDESRVGYRSESGYVGYAPSGGGELSWDGSRFAAEDESQRRAHGGAETRLLRPPQPQSETSDAFQPDERAHGWAAALRQGSSSFSGEFPTTSIPGGGEQHRGREAGRDRADGGAARGGSRRRSPHLQQSRQDLLDAVMRERAARTAARRQPRASRSRARGAPAGGEHDRIAQLAQPRSVERYARQHVEEAESAMKECTFAPKICPRSERVCNAPHRRDLSLPPGERLYRAHDHVRKVRDRKVTEALTEELAGCTFRPQLRARSARRGSGRPHVPLQKRAGDLVKQRNERIAQTRLQQDMCDPDATFTPAFNQRSLRLAEARRTKAATGSAASPEAAAAARPRRAASCGPAGRGGSAAAGRSASPRPDRSKAPADEEACTFRPAVNEATDAHLNRGGIPVTFMERQAFYDQRRRELAHVKMRQADDKECTFKPVTANPEDILATSTRRVHLEETQEEFWLRLNDEAARRQTALQAIENVQAAQHTFQPTINPKSRQMARKKGVEELSAAPQRAAFREAAAHAAEQRLSHQCTFHPDTSKPGAPAGYFVAPKAPFSVATEPTDTLTERIHEYQEAKGRRLEEIRNRRQYDELVECTFAPAINPAAAAARRASSRRPVQVRGLAAHLSKQEQAQRKAAAEAELRARLFLERPRSPRGKFTIAKPFNLSNAQPGRLSKKEAMRSEVQSETMKECTFKPQTNEGKKKHVLEQILAADAALLPSSRYSGTA